MGKYISQNTWNESISGITAGSLPDAGAEFMYETGMQRMLDLAMKGVFSEGDKVLDFGCGNGRHAIAATGMDISYVGMDPMEAPVSFCKRTFAEWKNMSFMKWDVRNDMYNPEGSVDPEDAKLPLETDSFDAAYAFSVFSHTETEKAAENLMNELKRVVKSGGHLYTTWFATPPNDSVDTDARRTVYERTFIDGLHESMKIVGTCRGTTKRHHDQLEIHSVNA